MTEEILQFAPNMNIEVYYLLVFFLSSLWLWLLCLILHLLLHLLDKNSIKGMFRKILIMERITDTDVYLMPILLVCRSFEREREREGQLNWLNLYLQN